MRRFWLILSLFAVLALIVWGKEDRGVSITRDELERMGYELNDIAADLRGYGKEYGYPSNDEGLAALWSKKRKGYYTQELSPFFAKAADNEKFDPLSVQHYGSDWPLICFLPTHEGLEDPFGLPVGYENRLKDKAGRYRSSPLNEVLVGKDTSWLLAPVATRGRKLQWWRKVDEGIYIYSFAGRNRWQKVMEASRTQMMGFFVISLFLLFFIYKWQKAPKVVQVDSKAVQAQGYMRTVNWILGSLLFVTGLVTIPDFRMCYSISLWGRRYKPEAAKEYVTMIDDFQKCGVLKKETAEKLRRAASEEAFEKRYMKRRENSAQR